MRVLKAFALVSLTVAVCGAASTASAAELYSGETTLSTPLTFHVTLKPGTSLKLMRTDGTPVNTCTGSTIEGDITSLFATMFTGHINVFTWSGCSSEIKTLTNGSISINESETVSGSGTVTTVAFSGISCRYGTGGGTHLGTLEQTSEDTNLKINAVFNEQEPKSFLCADTTRFEGNYMFISPKKLRVWP